MTLCLLSSILTMQELSCRFPLNKKYTQKLSNVDMISVSGLLAPSPWPCHLGVNFINLLPKALVPVDLR
jgi:hypothetical protein